MRVVYAKSIYKKIEDAIYLAQAQNKVIEEIILNKDEMTRLQTYVVCDHVYINNKNNSTFCSPATWLHGVRIRQE